jgi:hypothetical protein
VPGARLLDGVGRADQGRGAVGEQGVGHGQVGVPAEPEVQAAQLRGAEQDAGRRVGLDEGPRDPQTVQRPVAPHEADVGAPDRRVEAQFPDQRQVEAGGREPGA